MNKNLVVTDNDAIAEFVYENDDAYDDFKQAELDLQAKSRYEFRMIPGFNRDVITDEFYGEVPYTRISDKAVDGEDTIVLFPQNNQHQHSDYTRILMTYLHRASGGSQVISLFNPIKSELPIGQRFEDSWLIDSENDDVIVDPIASIDSNATKYANALGHFALSNVRIVGIQTGAGIGASVAKMLDEDRDIDVTSLLSIEPLNVIDRSPYDIYTATSPGTYAGRQRVAIQKTHIKALSEAYPEYTDSLGKRIKENIKGRMFSKNMNHRRNCFKFDNGALLRSLANNTLFDQLETLENTYKVILQGGSSEVSPQTYILDQLRILKATTRMVQSPTMGSEIIYDIPTIALLSSYAHHKS